MYNKFIPLYSDLGSDVILLHCICMSAIRCTLPFTTIYFGVTKTVLMILSA